MKYTMIGCAGLVGLVALICGGVGCSIVAKIPELKQENVECDKQWSMVQSAYQRRADLIPNLVNTIKGSATFEHDTLTDVAKAQQQVTNITLKPDDPNSMKQFLQAHAQLSFSTTNLANFVRQKFPKLATTGAFTGLMAQLEGTENRCNNERRKYNEAVDLLNKDLVSLTGMVANRWANVKERKFFEADEGAKTAPKVDFEKKS